MLVSSPTYADQASICLGQFPQKDQIVSKSERSSPEGAHPEGFTTFLNNKELTPAEVMDGLQKHFYPSIRKLAHSGLQRFPKLRGQPKSEGAVRPTALANDVFLKLIERWDQLVGDTRRLEGLCRMMIFHALVDYSRQLCRMEELAGNELADAEHDQRVIRSEWLRDALDEIAGKDETMALIVELKLSGATYREMESVVGFKKDKCRELFLKATKQLGAQAEQWPWANTGVVQ